MNRDIIEEMLHRLAIKVYLSEQYREEYKRNVRECPFYSEMIGMREAMQVMGINVDFEYNDDLKITALKVDDIRVEI